MDTYPNPWEFNNGDKKLTSYTGKYKLEYYNLNEIAMGAPIGGECYVITEDNTKLKIGSWFAGPPVWETSSNLLTIPKWTRTILKGTVQKIVIADIDSKKIFIFSPIFNVLDLRTFDKNIIYGCDSPIYQPKVVSFDINTAKIDKVLALK
ncbi:MAG: hypothetical protein ACO1OF_09830 [Adhaeribacter sp.]